jgi:hypothetical protein
MKYILMMNTMKAGHGVPGWPKKAHIGFMIGVNKELHGSRSFRAATGIEAAVLVFAKAGLADRFIGLRCIQPRNPWLPFCPPT